MQARITVQLKELGSQGSYRWMPSWAASPSLSISRAGLIRGSSLLWWESHALPEPPAAERPAPATGRLPVGVSLARTVTGHPGFGEPAQVTPSHPGLRTAWGLGLVPDQSHTARNWHNSV